MPQSRGGKEEVGKGGEGQDRQGWVELISYLEYQSIERISPIDLLVVQVEVQLVNGLDIGL